MNSERSRRTYGSISHEEDDDDEDWESTNDPKKMNFIQKVFEMVNASEYDHCVRWGESGDVFIVPDVEELERSVLPQYFKSSNVSSFVRQLNFYGFRQIRSCRKLTKTRDPKQTWKFQHPYFTKHSSQEELTAIKRKTALNNADPTRVELDMYREQLTALRQENEELKQDNTEKDNKIKQLKTQVSKYESEMEELRNQLRRASMTQQLATAAGQAYENGGSQVHSNPGEQLYPATMPKCTVNSAFNRSYQEAGRSDNGQATENIFNTSWRTSDQSGSLSHELGYPHRQNHGSGGDYQFTNEARLFSNESDVSLGDRSVSADSQSYSLFAAGLEAPQSSDPERSLNGNSIDSPAVTTSDETSTEPKTQPSDNEMENEIVCTTEHMCLKKGDIRRVQNYVTYTSETEVQSIVQTLLDNMVHLLVEKGSLEMSTMYENQATRQLTPRAKMKVATFIAEGTGPSQFNQAAAEIAVFPNSGVTHNLQNHPGKTILVQLIDHFSPEVVFSCILPIPRVQRCLVRLFNIPEKVLQDLCGSTQANPQAAINCLMQVVSNQIGYGYL